MQTVGKSEKYLTLDNKRRMLVVKYEDIEYVKSNGRKIVIVTPTDEYEVYGKMYDITEKLDSANSYFCRCHKGYIVNFNHIAEFGRKYIILKSGKEIPVGKFYLEDTKQKFFEFLEM